MPAPGLLVLSVVSSVHLAVLVGLSELQPFCWDRVLPQLPPEVPVVVLAVVVLQWVVATRVGPALEEVAGVAAAAGAAAVAAAPVGFVVVLLPVRV